MVDQHVFDLGQSCADKEGHMKADLMSFRVSQRRAGGAALISGANAAIIKNHPTPSSTASFASSFR
jgi:hypothetical protein